MYLKEKSPVRTFTLAKYERSLNSVQSSSDLSYGFRTVSDTMDTYGEDHEDLRSYIRSFGSQSISVELIEVFKEPGGLTRVTNEPYSDIDSLRDHLFRKVRTALPFISCVGH